MEATGNDLSLASLSMNDIIRSLPVKKSFFNGVI